MNTDLIRCAVNNSNCERAFTSTDVNQKFELFSKTILNILSNFIIQETITCDDKDPPWMTNEIKYLIINKRLFIAKVIIYCKVSSGKIKLLVEFFQRVILFKSSI